MTSPSPVKLTAESLPKFPPKPSVIAIGLDSADPKRLRDWMAAGHLPHLSRLRDRGAYGSLQGLPHYKAETPWTTFLTGVFPESSGYWGEIKLRPNSYGLQDIQAYDFAEYPPFYALGDRHRVAVFDVPKSRLNSQTHGRQITAWGAHSPSAPPGSSPEDLYAQVNAQFGPHPTFQRDHGAWWNPDYLHQLHQGLLEGIQRRSNICQDWLQQEPWDLFLTVFGETHAAEHDFGFLSDPTHPLYGERSRFFKGQYQGQNPLLNVYSKVDQAIGEIMEVVPDDAHIVVFSLHGSSLNSGDLPAMFFLSEFLYRFSFPEEPGRIAIGNIHHPVPRPCFRPLRKTWPGEVWSRRNRLHSPRRQLLKLLPRRLRGFLDRALGPPHALNLASPKALKQSGDPFFWQPTSWYQPFWPQMQAFALPSFSEGYIRINLQGREPQGIVASQGYDRLCQQITEALYDCRNPRTDTAIVKTVTRTRQQAHETDPRLPDADLIVEWNDFPADTFDSPRYGRIGPVPFRRTGGHRAEGFLLAQGPGIPSESHLPTGTLPDVSATLLTLMGAPIPPHIQGKSLIPLPTRFQSPA